MEKSVVQELIENAVEQRNRQIANLLWNTGKLSEEEIKQITDTLPTRVDAMHGVSTDD